MSFDVSTNAEFDLTAEVVRRLAPLAAECGADLLLVGAAARDLLVTARTGDLPLRRTNDVDIAIAVGGWADFACVTRTLDRVGAAEHKFRVVGVEVDVVPFGGVEDAERTIRWPDDHVMNVLGFAEALRSAVSVMLPGGVVVGVASLPAQVVLKVNAWRDRGHYDGRDAIDLLTLLRAYSEGDYLTELYERHGDSLERHDFDPVLAGADRLGYEAGALLAVDDRAVVTTLLDGECSGDGRLPAAMGRDVARNRELLLALYDGMRRVP
jgi:predicted nucleotidyltransferase